MDIDREAKLLEATLRLSQLKNLSDLVDKLHTNVSTDLQ